MRDNHGIPAYDSNTLLVISADFSHFLDMKTAISLENKAARAIMFNHLVRSHNMEKVLNVIDEVDSFRLLFRLLPNANIQWIGRTRSPGLKGVGYLSFLIRHQPVIYKLPRPSGIFISAYDRDMKYLELKESIEKKVQLKKNNLINLEKILLDLKMNLESSN